MVASIARPNGLQDSNYLGSRVEPEGSNGRSCLILYATSRWARGVRFFKIFRKLQASEGSD